MKRILIFLIIFLIFSFNTVFAVKYKGDLNSDGEISILDIRLLLQDYINSNNRHNSLEMNIRDMNQNQKIDIEDIRLLLQKYINGGPLEIIPYVVSGPQLIEPLYPTDETIVADFIISPSDSGEDMSDIINDTLLRCWDPNGNSGGTVFLEAGIYHISKPINIPCNVVLRGDYQDPDNYSGELKYGTIIVVDEDFGLKYVDTNNEVKEGNAIHLDPNSGAIGLTIYYEAQTIESPKEYAFTFGFNQRQNNNVIRNITMINSYRGIGRQINNLETYEPYAEQYDSFMLYVENIKGTVLKTGFVYHNTAEIGTISGLYLKPDYWADANLDALGEKDINKTVPSKETIIAKVKEIKGNGIILTDTEQNEMKDIVIDGYYNGLYIPNADVVKTRFMGCGSLYNLNISNCVRGIMVEPGVYHKENHYGTPQDFSMIDYRFGYVISNSYIEGSEYSIYTDSPKVQALAIAGGENLLQGGSIKLKDVTLQGPTGGQGGLVYYSEEDNKYVQVDHLSTNGKIKNKHLIPYTELGYTRNKINGNNFLVVEPTYKKYEGNANFDVDDSININTALAEVGNKGGGVVYLNSGFYNIKTPIMIPANTELRGSNGIQGIYANACTTVNITNTNQYPIQIVGDNAGVSGIYFIYISNINKLNNDANPTYDVYPYTIYSEGTSNGYINNVTISAGTFGVNLMNCNNYTINNSVFGVLENAIIISESNQVRLSNITCNAAHIARNCIIPYDESNDRLFRNVINRYTYKKLRYIYLSNSTNIQVQNAFVFGSWVYLTSINSTSYLVNTGSDTGQNTNNNDTVMYYLAGTNTMNAINTVLIGGQSLGYTTDDLTGVSIHNLEKSHILDGIFEPDVIN